MKQRTFQAMGTDWTVLAEGCDSEAMIAAEERVRDVEERLSRFLPHSAVSRLNRDREASDPVLAAVMHEAMGFWRDTGGAFDPRLGAQLASLGWYVFFAPAKTPAPLLDAWGKELNAVLALPEVQKKLVELGLDVEPATPAEFRARLVNDLGTWQKTVDAIGYKPQG